MARIGGNPQIPITAKNETDKAFKAVQKNLQDLAASAALIQGPLGSVAGRINSLGAAIGRMNPLVLGASGAIAAFTAIQYKSIPAAVEYEKQLFQLSAQVQLTGYRAGFTANRLDQMAAALDTATLASEKGARDAIAGLLTFSKVSGSVFEDALKLGQDWSAVWGTDLQANVRNIGKALQDPKTGLENLKRAGVDVNEVWRDQIIAMFENGEEMKAQLAIIERLKNTLGGQGEAQASGVAGALDYVGQQWQRLYRTVGASDIFGRMAKGAGLLLHDLNTALAPTLDEQLTNVLDQIKKFREIKKEAGSRSIVDTRAITYANTQLKDLVHQYAVLMERKKEVDHQDEIAANLARRTQRERAAEADAIARIDKQLSLAIKTEKDLDKATDEHDKTVTKAYDNYNNLLTHSMTDAERLGDEYRAAAVALGELVKAQNTVPQVDAAGNITQVFQELSPEKAKETAKELEHLYDVYVKGLDKLDTAEKKRQYRATAQIEEIQKSLHDEEGAVQTSYNRRGQIILDALTDIADKEDSISIARKKELTQALVDLEEARQKEISDIRRRNILQASRDSASIIGSIADYYDGAIQRQTKSTNDFYQKRADIINTQVKNGILTEEQGNAKLRELEARRQQQLNATAKKQFDRNKKLRRAEAIINTYASAVAAFNDTPGPIWVRLIASAAAIAAGLANVSAINAQQYDGGGGVASAASSGLSSAPQQQQQQQSNSGQNVINLLIVGQQNQPTSFTDKRGIAKFLTDMITAGDLVLVKPGSRQMNEIIQNVRMAR
jgi:hypothetical protein